MAQSNKRYFNTFFFEDPYIEDLDFHTRYLYLTMILNPHNNLAGCYELSISKLINYTGMPEEKIRAGIQKLQEDKKILFSGNWLALKNFIKNNELNPNMCKNAFDVMKIAPKDKIIFIISDQAGNAEPWLEEFIDKVGRGINASIDSKNRNLIKKAKANGEKSPLLEKHHTFTLETFTNIILNPSVRLLEGNPSPNPSPNPSKSNGEPLGEYKGEDEIEYEYEKEIEKESEKATLTQPFETYTGKPENNESIMDTVKKLSEEKKAK